MRRQNSLPAECGATGYVAALPEGSTGESVEGEGVTPKRRRAAHWALPENLISPPRLQIKPETGSNCLGRMTNRPLRTCGCGGQ